MGLLDAIYRVGEPAAAVGSGVLAEPVAGWAGLLGGGAQGVNRLRDLLTYQPQTEAGKQGANTLAELLRTGKTALVDNNPPVRNFLNSYNELADDLGDFNPFLGAVMRTAPAAASMLGTGPARGALASAGRSLAPKAGEMAERYMMQTGGMAHILPPDVFKALVDKQRSGQKLSVTERVMLQNHQSDTLGGLDDAIRSATPPPPAPQR